MTAAETPRGAPAAADSITIFPAAHPSARVSVQPAQHAGPETQARVARVWQDLRAANDRLYDGPILRSVSLDAERAEVLCRRDTFRSLATSARLGLGVRQLGVSGVIIAKDTAGIEHLLLGRRAADTRIYPGLWEFAPSGGVKPPPPNVDSLSLLDLATALAEEADEELGMQLDPRDARLLAFLRDETACSDDAILRFDLSTPVNPRAGVCPAASEAAGRWEYVDSAWVALSGLPNFSREHAHAIAPPTLALLRWLNWAG